MKTLFGPFTREDADLVDGSDNEQFVSQHDLLRELSIHQSSLLPVKLRKRLFIEITENDLPSWLMEHKQQPTNAQLLSITTGLYSLVFSVKLKVNKSLLSS